MIYMKNICCPFMIITAESVAVFVDCDYNSLNCDVTLRRHQIYHPPPNPCLQECIPNFNGKWAGPPAESRISIVFGGQAGPPGEGEIYCFN